jgi:NAD-dependent dihydropyrimidine dehydrogenase PreA subunit
MNEEDIEVYKQLQQHLDSFPIGFPTTKSGIEFEVLKHLFTPKEAIIATKLNFSWSENLESLENIYERVKPMGISLEKLEKALDNMAHKGTIHSKKEGNKKYYANSLFMYGMYELQVDNLTKDFLKKAIKYMLEGFGMESYGTKIPQFRTVPVEESIEFNNAIPTYDYAREVIKNAEEPIMVANCLCRQATDLSNRPCKVTDRRETHLGFGHLAQMYIDQGKGRQINKEEALEILKKSEEEGLVLQAANSLNPHFFCSCCGCCCVVLAGLKRFPRPIDFVDTNYLAEINRELCSGCKDCIEICQMEAIKLVKKTAKVNWKRCIGCGNCVPVCPENAIQLRKKQEEINPPSTMEDLYQKILTKKQEIRARK